MHRGFAKCFCSFVDSHSPLATEGCTSISSVIPETAWTRGCREQLSRQTRHTFLPLDLYPKIHYLHHPTRQFTQTEVHWKSASFQRQLQTAVVEETRTPLGTCTASPAGHRLGTDPAVQSRLPQTWPTKTTKERRVTVVQSPHETVAFVSVRHDTKERPPISLIR